MSGFSNGRSRLPNHQTSFRAPLAQRFAAKFSRRGDDECWLWTANTNRHGYGAIYIDEKAGSKPATHVALELDGRPRPSQHHHALHNCDNPPCVNPHHLRWGTHQENMRERQAKGRMNISGFAKSWAKTSEQRYRSHCRRGHALAGPGLYVSPGGQRLCAVCLKARRRQRPKLGSRMRSA